MTGKGQNMYNLRRRNNNNYNNNNKTFNFIVQVLILRQLCFYVCTMHTIFISASNALNS